jgi:hypothetical protein
MSRGLDSRERQSPGNHAELEPGAVFGVRRPSDAAGAGTGEQLALECLDGAVDVALAEWILGLLPDFLAFFVQAALDLKLSRYLDADHRAG